jgi:hypothetical protein
MTNAHEISITRDTLAEIEEAAQEAYDAYFGETPWRLKSYQADAVVVDLMEGTGRRIPSMINGWRATLVAAVDEIRVRAA